MLSNLFQPGEKRFLRAPADAVVNLGKCAARSGANRAKKILSRRALSVEKLSERLGHAGSKTPFIAAPNRRAAETTTR
jgi:hypothetical protein